MGESGETYIVGDDLLMRSDSRFLLEDKEAYYALIRGMGVNDDLIELIDKLNTTILLQPVRTEGARAALRGEEGHFVAADYRGVTVLATYSKLDIDGLNWGIVSEINEDEAFAPIGPALAPYSSLNGHIYSDRRLSLFLAISRLYAPRTKACRDRKKPSPKI